MGKLVKIFEHLPWRTHYITLRATIYSFVFLNGVYKHRLDYCNVYSSVSEYVARSWENVYIRSQEKTLE